MLLHCFEQCRLCLGRGAIDLVREHEVGEDRASLEAQAAPTIQVLADDGGADNVSGHQIGCELDAAEPQRQHIAEGAHQERLAEARDTLEQHVTATEQGDEDQAHHLALPDDGFVQLGLDAGRALGERLDGLAVQLFGGESDLEVGHLVTFEV